MIFASCATAPSRQFLDQDLLLEQSVVPEDWTLLKSSNYPFDDEQGQISGAYIIYDYKTLSIFARFGEDVYRYSSISKAKRHYTRMEKELFNEHSAYASTPIEIPAGFTFTSQSADQWRFGCYGNTFLYDDLTRCQYLARYDEFLIDVVFPQYAEGQELISLDEIQQILSNIDEIVTRMLNYDNK
jgi:hypothetical protein